MTCDSVSISFSASDRLADDAVVLRLRVGDRDYLLGVTRFPIGLLVLRHSGNPSIVNARTQFGGDGGAEGVLLVPIDAKGMEKTSKLERWRIGSTGVSEDEAAGIISPVLLRSAPDASPWAWRSRWSGFGFGFCSSLACMELCANALFVWLVSSNEAAGALMLQRLVDVGLEAAAEPQGWRACPVLRPIWPLFHI